MFAVVVVAALAAAPPLLGTGGVMTEVRPLQTDPSEVTIKARALDVSGAFQVRVVSGEPVSFVELTGESDLLPHIVTRLDKDTIVIDTDVPVRSRRGIIIVVHLPLLERVKLSGAVLLEAVVRGDDIRVEADGDHALLLSGAGRSARFELDGGAVVDALALKLDHAVVDVTGLCGIRVDARASLSVSGSGTVTVEHRGAPKLSQRFDGALTVVALDAPAVVAAPAVEVAP